MEPLEAEGRHCVRPRVRGVLNGAATDLADREADALMEFRGNVDESAGTVPEVLQSEFHDFLRGA